MGWTVRGGEWGIVLGGEGGWIGGAGGGGGGGVEGLGDKAWG